MAREREGRDLHGMERRPEGGDLGGGMGVPRVHDGNSGRLLHPGLVAAAWRERMDFIQIIALREEVSVDECKREAGRTPINAKWVDANQGSGENPSVRCRLVAGDCKPKGEKHRPDIVAAMPSLEATRI